MRNLRSFGRLRGLRMTPSASLAERLDLHVHTRRKLELHERVDRLGRRLENVEQPLVRPHLELLTRLLVDVRAAQHGVPRNLGGQRNRSRYPRSRAPGRVHDFTRRLVKHSVVVRLQTDADLFVHHDLIASKNVEDRQSACPPSYDYLLENLRNRAGAHRAAALTNREAETLLHRDRSNQVDRQRGVVTRHDHLRALGQLRRAGDVGRTEVELRTIAIEERRVTAALFLRQDVDLGLELRVRGDRARLGANLAALDVLALDTAEQEADVVARLTLVEELAEHLDARDDLLLGRTDTDDLDFLTDFDDAALDTARDDGAAARDREDVFDRHQERLVDGALRQRNVAVDRVHELHDLLAPLRVRIAALERLEGGDADDGKVVAGELVAGEQLADLELDELEEVRISGVDLVEGDDDRQNADLAGQQDVLARLRHRAVSGGDNEDRTVHLRGAGDHVLDVVGVTRAVDVRIVALLGRVLHVGGGDGDAAFALFGSLVDLVECHE